MNHAVLASSGRLSWFALLLTLAMVAPAKGQGYEITGNSAMWVNGDYHTSEDVSGIGIGLDWSSVNGRTGIGWQVGVTFGPANGVYGGELSSSEIRDAASSQMSGSTLERFEAPDETDGGFLLGGKAMLSYFLAVNTSVAVGPRISYYTPQEISVLTVSTGGGFEYTEFAQVPYREATMIPGIEIQVQPGMELGFRYAYFFRGAGEPPMHMFGVGWAFVM